jgi:hypothetical protein
MDRYILPPHQFLHPSSPSAIMADEAEQEAIHAAELKKKRQFRKYAYRGVDLEDLLDKSSEEVPLPPRHQHPLPMI